ncbi:hypothetical protein Ancab_012471 [Ancistrocladus abbreviatus]
MCFSHFDFDNQVMLLLPLLVSAGSVADTGVAHFHFLSQHGLKDAQDGVDYVTWTMVAFLIFSVLWLVKTILLLRWEAEAGDHRYTTRMLRAGFQAYFLVAIMASSVQKSERTKQRDKLKKKAKENLMPSSQDVKTYRSNLNPKKEENEAFFEGEEKQDATTLSLKLIASYLILVAKRLSRGSDDEISRLQARHITADDLKKFQLDDKESDRVYKVLQGNPPVAKVITYEMFEEWMKPEESSRDVEHNISTHLTKHDDGKGYLMVDAMKRLTRCAMPESSKDSQVRIELKESSTEDDIANLQAKCQKIKDDHEYIISKTDLSKFRLDEIESEVLYEEVQGNPPSENVTYAMFEKWMMEVKCMSILTTIFLKLSPPEEIFYPNSVLATKPIVNLKDEPDPSDAVELNLDGDTTKENIEALKEEIANFVNNSDHARKYDGPIHVMLKEVGSSIKMDVYFKHSMNILDNHAQCLQRKKMQRSEFLLHVKKFLDDLGTKKASD